VSRYRENVSPQDTENQQRRRELIFYLAVIPDPPDEIAVAFYLRFNASASIAATPVKEYRFSQPDRAAGV